LNTLAPHTLRERLRGADPFIRLAVALVVIFDARSDFRA